MFGIGLAEVILIAVLALMILGPEKFPDMAKKAGKLFAQFQRMGREFKNTVAELDVDETKKHPPKEGEGGEPKADSLDDLSEDESGDGDEEGGEDEKAIALAQLRRWIKHGNHLKRPFRSDILTVAEIDKEVGAAQDAPFPPDEP